MLQSHGPNDVYVSTEIWSFSAVETEEHAGSFLEENTLHSNATNNVLMRKHSGILKVQHQHLCVMSCMVAILHILSLIVLTRRKDIYFAYIERKSREGMLRFYAHRQEA